MFSWLERKLTYKPDKVQYADISQFDFVRTELEGQGESTTVFAKLTENQPTVLFSHGNTGNVSFHPWYYKLFESLGVSYVAYDYPGYGDSKGRPSEEALYRSGRAVWSFLTQDCRRDPATIFHYGLSLGGGVAMELASSAPSAGVILECTFTDSRSMAKYIYPRVPLYRFVPNRFCNKDKMTRIEVPALIIHGTLDPTVPVDMAHELHASHPGKKELYIVEGAAHADIGVVGSDMYKTKIAEFLGKR